MASEAHQAAAGSDSGQIPAAFGAFGLPGAVCALCDKQINDKGACKMRCQFGNLRKQDGVPASCICYCLTRLYLLLQ